LVVDGIVLIKVVGAFGRPNRCRSSNSEVVVVQGGVEQQEEAALGLVTPHRVVGEHDYVSFANRNVDDRWLAHKVGAAREHPADQQVFLVGGEAQDDPGTKLGWRNQWPQCRPQLLRNLLTAWPSGACARCAAGTGSCAAACPAARVG